MQITFSPSDREFAERLASDLEHRGLNVVLRQALDPTHAAVEISELPHVLLISTSAPGWDAGTLAASLPVVIDDVALPASIGEIKYANFAASYESELKQLLGSIWPAISRPPFEHHRRQFAYAFKATGNDRLPPNMAPFVLLDDKFSVATTSCTAS